MISGDWYVCPPRILDPAVHRVCKHDDGDDDDDDNDDEIV